MIGKRENEEKQWEKLGAWKPMRKKNDWEEIAYYKRKKEQRRRIIA